ncbi:MAG: polymer-forming cytoskeletal protein [Actinomycetota bacterium]|nr:polymer-forming cytoskeletal protein [Actinomycetota bacterium]
MGKFRSVGARKLLILAGLALLVGLVAASPVQAVETRSGEEVVIGPDEVIEDDLYVFANEVVVDGTIRGDLVAFGSNITVDGTVEEDLTAAGQTVEIGGTVDDDARVAGQALLLSQDALVSDDLIAAAFSLENEPDSAIGGTLIYAGYQALLSGTIDEDVDVAANALELDGEVGGDVDAEVDGEDGAPQPSLFMPTPRVQMPTVEPGLTLTGLARVGGNLTYESSDEADISPAARIGGELVRTERPAEEEKPTGTVADAVLDNLRSLVELVLVGLLLMWLAPYWTRRLADTIQARPLSTLGWGVLGFIVFVALGVAILLVTILLAVIFGFLTLGSVVLLIIGLGLLVEGALVLAFFISTSYLAQIVVSFLVGRLLLGRVLPNRAAGRVLPLIVGLILYVVLRAIPVLGILVGLIVVLLGLGALFNAIWTVFRRRPAHPPPAG